MGCSRASEPQLCEILLLPPAPESRAGDPDDSLISDYNIFVFNSFGQLEDRSYVPVREYEGGNVHHITRLVREAPYDVFVAVNLGYRLECNSLEELLEYRYHLAYPDEFSKGIPMAGWRRMAVAGDERSISVPLERLMARAIVSLDRSALDSGVQLKVERISVGACPSSVRLFGESKARSREDLFLRGYTKSGSEADALNREQSPGMSFPLALYLLENCQGPIPESRMTTMGEVCSWVELELQYRSASMSNAPGKSLVYRFRLGEGEDRSVKRNSSYSYVLRPSGDGLGDGSWNVDSGGIRSL